MTKSHLPLPRPQASKRIWPFNLFSFFSDTIVAKLVTVCVCLCVHACAANTIFSHDVFHTSALWHCYFLTVACFSLCVCVFREPTLQIGTPACLCHRRRMLTCTGRAGVAVASTVHRWWLNHRACVGCVGPKSCWVSAQEADYDDERGKPGANRKASLFGRLGSFLVFFHPLFLQQPSKEKSRTD